MTSRTLAVNIGNSRTIFALIESDQVLARFVYPTDQVEFLPEAAPAEIEFEPDRILIASVVPLAVGSVQRSLARWFPAMQATVVTHQMVPLASAYIPENSLGIDRLLSGFAAFELYGKPKKSATLVIDLGTATTFNCVSSDGLFLGGVITLGVHSTFRAIGEMTAQLPTEVLQIPDRVLATKTSEAIRSGVFFSSILGIKGIAKLLIDEVFGSEPHVVLYTGGAAALLAEYLVEDGIIDSDLLLKGIGRLPN